MWRRLRDVTADELAGLSLAHPLRGAEGSTGEWDDLRDFRAADFVTDEEGTGFVHCAPSHGMDEYLLYQELGMLDQVITTTCWTMAASARICRSSAAPASSGKTARRATPTRP